MTLTQNSAQRGIILLFLFFVVIQHMVLDLTPEQDAFKQSIEQFAREVVAPRAAIDESGEFPTDVMRAGGGPRPARRHDSDGLGRRRARLRQLRARHRSDRPGERDGRRLAVGHQLARRRAHRARRPRAAERAMAAHARDRRGDRRVRAVGARRRHRRGQSADEGGPERRTATASPAGRSGSPTPKPRRSSSSSRARARGCAARA